MMKYILQDFLVEFGNNLMIFSTNFYDYEEYLLTSAFQIAPLPPCQQVSAFQIPLPPSKMLTYFMDGPRVKESITPRLHDILHEILD